MQYPTRYKSGIGNGNGSYPCLFDRTRGSTMAGRNTVRTVRNSMTARHPPGPGFAPVFSERGRHIRLCPVTEGQVGGNATTRSKLAWPRAGGRYISPWLAQSSPARYGSTPSRHQPASQLSQSCYACCTPKASSLEHTHAFSRRCCTPYCHHSEVGWGRCSTR